MQFVKSVLHYWCYEKDFAEANNTQNVDASVNAENGASTTHANGNKTWTHLGVGIDVGISVRMECALRCWG